MKKKLLWLLIFAVGVFYIPNVFALDVQACKDALPGVSIDTKIADAVHTIILAIQIAVPVVLVIFGSLDLFKGIIASKEDEIKKGQQTFIKRLIAAAIIFFVVAIVKIIVSLVADDSNKIMPCVNCFLNGTKSNENCTTVASSIDGE